MKTIKKIILTVLLITTVTVCFAKPKDKAETEKMIQQFFQNGTCVVRHLESWGEKSIRYINKDFILSIEILDNGLIFNIYGSKDTTVFSFDKFDIYLDSNSNLVIKKL